MVLKTFEKLTDRADLLKVYLFSLKKSLDLWVKYYRVITDVVVNFFQKIKSKTTEKYVKFKWIQSKTK